MARDIPARLFFVYFGIMNIKMIKKCENFATYESFRS